MRKAELIIIAIIIGSVFGVVSGSIIGNTIKKNISDIKVDSQVQIENDRIEFATKKEPVFDGFFYQYKDYWETWVPIDKKKSENLCVKIRYAKIIDEHKDCYKIEYILGDDFKKTKWIEKNLFYKYPTPSELAEMKKDIENLKNEIDKNDKLEIKGEENEIND